MEIRVGTSSWTDPTLLQSGWYPKGTKSAEDRLRFYASNFSLVEVDSTYYGMPSERNAALWAERTPADFTFDIKAFALLTGHAAEAKGLPASLRHAFSGNKRVQRKDLPDSIVDMMFEMFASALMPLHSAGKLGMVLFQFPPWFDASEENEQWIASCVEKLADFQLAVEFRNATWVADAKTQSRSMSLLKDLGTAYVAVDAPQGFKSSMPKVLEATCDQLSVVRFHGRNVETWEAKGVTAAERFNYLYSVDELQEWLPGIKSLAEQVRRTHVLFNNCHGDKGVKNAAQLSRLLGLDPPQTQPPAQGTLL